MTDLANSGVIPKRLGILGGMGPLASAEFLKTLYECFPYEREQDAPVCLLVSDPTFPWFGMEGDLLAPKAQHAGMTDFINHQLSQRLSLTQGRGLPIDTKSPRPKDLNQRGPRKILHLSDTWRGVQPLCPIGQRSLS